ncbi:MAG: DUF192 domain-containing protein [Dictyoglomus thermophilum]|nr:DUF192 domain-containing protein [Dictyoglomus thermophilum]MCX7720346.1 DUF192 domain-containing protein [Dictyoglomus thermophilum]
MKKRTVFFTTIFTILLMIVIFSLLSLGKENSAKFPRGRLLITQGGKSLEIPIEIADRDELWTLGLMYRKSIPWEYGMLFVFPYDTNAGFWMKNTYVPLDIAFILEDGTIINIQRMEPCKDELNCPIYFSPKPYRYALEVRAGFFERYGFSVGAKIKYWRE